MVRVFSFLILLCGALQPLLAQQPTPVGEDESQCGMTHVNNPDVIRKAEQNTRARYPGLDEVMRRSLEKVMPQVLGTQEIFWTYNFKDNRYDTVRAELLAIGALSYVWVAVGEINNAHVTQAEADAILDALENRTPRTSQDSTKGILRLERRFFGDPPNINSSFVKGAGDGKTHFLVYDIVDGYSGGSFVGGYFHSKDVLPSTYSNRRDMLYIDSYPTIFLDGRRNPSAPLGLLAHELQHLIHWNYDPGEGTFFNEGLSELASFLCGFGLRSPNRYLSNPNVALLGWTSSSDDRVLADYSRAALMGYYLWDRYGETFIRNLTQQPLSGSGGFNAALNVSGFSGDLVEVVKNFQVANYVQDRSVGQSYGYAVPLGSMGRPRLQRDNFGPISSGVRTGVQPLGVEYLRLRVLDSLSGTINITSGVGDVQVIRTSNSGTSVTAVPSNSQYQTSFVGSSSSEVVFLVHNTRTATNLSYSYVTNGLMKQDGVLELSHDDGRTQRAPTTAMASNDTLHVAFEGVTKSKIDSIAMWFQTTGSARLMIRDWNSNYDISFQPRSGLSGKARLVAPTTFSVTDTGFFKTVVDLRQQNVGANSDFLVQIIYGFNAPHPLMRRDSAQGVIRSFLSIRSEPTPGRVIYQSTGDFYVRVYLSFTEQEVDQPPLAINTIVLRQNYPNPLFVRSTQPTTTIEYGITSDSHVKLEIFDLLGRRVRLLEDGARFAGFASIEWEGRDDTRQPVPSGVYLIRVQAGGFMQTKKMILLR